MKDLFYKLKFLWFVRELGGFRGWYRDVWSVELDELYCCDGYHCGCQASSNRDFLDWVWKERA
jgi:hypothetical protein